MTLTNQAVACKSDPAPVTGHVKTVEILVDRTSIETFVNEGKVSLGAFSPRRRPARSRQRPGAGTHPLTSRVRNQVDVGQELRIILFYQLLLGCDSVALLLRLSGSSVAITSSIQPRTPSAGRGT